MKHIEAARLARQAWVLHAFSTRVKGISRAPAAGLNLGHIESDKPKHVERNRQRFFRSLGATQFSLAEIHQVHSTLIYEVVRGKRGKLEYRPSGYPAPKGSQSPSPAGDALLTRESGVLLSVRAADCMPVLLADPKRRAVAAIHAGWRGALAGVVEKTVGEMVRIFGSRPADLLAAVGPSIRACCYQVGDEVVNAFCGRYPNGEDFFLPAPQDKVQDEISRRYPLLFLSKQPPGRGPDSVPSLHLDLPAVARYQLRRAGLANSKIQVVDFCTACRTDLFFSHRKEGGRTGRMMAVIGIRCEKPRANSRQLRVKG
ncbi:MAG TPA: peptidoglycan editing factor PgeF [Terriglobia bacterium]|nr:peptidoglycan editing factor PgeF [Terriglobia bacterium]